MEPRFFCRLFIHAHVFVYFVTLESRQMTMNFLNMLWGWIEIWYEKRWATSINFNESVDAVDVYKGWNLLILKWCLTQIMNLLLIKFPNFMRNSSKKSHSNWELLPPLKSKNTLNYNETHQINYSKDDKFELKQAKERQKSTSVPSFY